MERIYHLIILTTQTPFELLKEFKEPTVVACKHGNPCGVGSADNINDAWTKAFADKVSIFEEL